MQSTTRPRDRATTVVFSTKTATRRERDTKEVEAMLHRSRESAQDSGEVEAHGSLELDLDMTQDSREESSELEGKPPASSSDYSEAATPSPTPVRKRSRRSSRKGSSADKEQPTMNASVRRLRPSKALLQLETASVSECVQAMVKYRTEATLVTDASGTLTGILTDKDIALRVVAMGLDPETTLVVDVMTLNPSCVSPRACAIEALEQMISGQFRHLPVAENGIVVGILDIAKCLYDAISKIEQAYIASSNQFTETLMDANMTGTEASLFEMMRESLFLPTLRNIIDGSVDVPEIADGATTRQASLLMLQKNSSAVMVLRPNGEMVGILTTKDLMRRVLAVGKSPSSCLVRDAMTGNPDCARLDTTILDALHSMHDGKFLHLPVLNDDGAVVGLADVLQVTCSVVHQMGSFQKQHTASGNPLWNKFWNSMFNPPTPTPTSLRPPNEAPAVVTNAPEALFVYKLVDRDGNTHRFTASSTSLTALKEHVSARLGAAATVHYIDEDDGETVLLFVDADLELAVAQARRRRASYVRLTVKEPTTKGAEDEFDIDARLQALPIDETKMPPKQPGAASVMSESKLQRRANRQKTMLVAAVVGVTGAAYAFLRKKA
ncbi:hypothetical protein SPRG_01806 [Saprolegnia parasitica CBS 223.65]|uniref:CBS domain-containing protein n=1 Tax=Saprolegnia parasitica (strain CBS 223.65) TaxID=695850 RepID=A0A067D4H5_SAPPC|nr:hypothetical protein SPRG_01806 [Saprolegnia parasitica CBS 223.65]KDO33927.1 hypothetical protein SPRG_01806 [Saprolegnia parasitica CBS 223.65]|eukprot:XP_012195561.1 hypothetical protein SPRG_01806 [Saprolegnia parasitica CBS 223.65]